MGEGEEIAGEIGQVQAISGFIQKMKKRLFVTLVILRLLSKIGNVASDMRWFSAIPIL